MPYGLRWSSPQLTGQADFWHPTGHHLRAVGRPARRCLPMMSPVTLPRAGSSFPYEHGWKAQPARRYLMSAQEGRQQAAAQAGSVPAAPQRPSAPAREPRNAIRLGPRARRLIRAAARVVNPLVLRIAGRRHMPVVGIVHHRGRKTGREYATPLGVRPAPGGGFVMPLTFSEAAHWYQNIRAAGWCV